MKLRAPEGARALITKLQRYPASLVTNPASRYVGANPARRASTAAASVLAVLASDKLLPIQTTDKRLRKFQRALITKA